ncbi:MAG: DUF975 family protein [Clostridiales bacterium]|nr:DUF975 family protein [Clostridiales bacterium]
MWTRRQLKENAKKILSKNYWKAFLVTLVLITITGAGTSGFSSAGSSIGNSFGRSIGKSSNSNTNVSLNTGKDNDKDGDKDKNVNVNIGDGKISIRVEGDKVYVNGKQIQVKDGESSVDINGHNIKVNGTDGTISFDGKNIKVGDSEGTVDIEKGKLTVKDGNGKVLFNGSIFEEEKVMKGFLGVLTLFFVVFGIIIVFICIIGTLIDIFVINPVRVGGYNFFNNQHDGTSKFTNIFGGFAHGHYKASVRNMFLKGLYEALWSMLFIIPGIIKSYSYWMVPYITAANPNLSASRAFEISKKTMNGDKWHTFVLQLSFIGWDLLALLTFGVGYYFLAPYKETTYAELYATLKQKAITNGIATEEELAVAA